MQSIPNRPARRGLASVELVLMAPILLAVLWMLFFFAGAWRHKQQVQSVIRSGTWLHVRAFGDSGHNHADIAIDPLDWPELIAWTGDAEADWFLVQTFHLAPETEPTATALDDAFNGEGAGGVTRLAGLVSRGGQQGAENGNLFWTIPRAPRSTETWQLSAWFTGETAELLGRSTEREAVARLRMDAGVWPDGPNGYIARLRVLGGPTTQHTTISTAATELLSGQLVSPRDARLLEAVSLFR